MDKWDQLPGLLPQVKADLRRMEVVFGVTEDDLFVEQRRGGETMSGDGEAPFDVVEEYELGDLTTVKEDRINVPTSSNVLLTVRQATSRALPDNSIKFVALQLAIEEGVPVPNPDTGEVNMKFQGKVLFQDLPYWVDTVIRTSPRFTGENRSYLNPLKMFLKAMGYDIASPPKINDTFFGELQGRQLRANITLREIRLEDPKGSGNWKGTGDFRNEVKGFKPA
jgi:hypothetical protein